MTYHVVEAYRSYLYYSHLNAFRHRLFLTLTSFEFYGVDCSAVLTELAKTLDQIYLPDFVITFDAWLKKQPVSPKDRYIQYFKDEHGKWRPGILQQNAFIEKLAEKVCDTMLKNINTCLTRLLADFPEIRAKLNVAEYISGITSLEILGGDRHEHGQQPVLIVLGDTRIIYKPRDSGVESLINAICITAGMAPVCPKTLSKKTHLWQAHIQNRPLSSPEKGSDVYRRYGNILALVDLLNINDCHFENFVVDQHQVYLIDAETSFQYFFDDNPDFERSIFQSGLLQSPEVTSNGIGHTAALTAITSVFKSFTYPHAVNDGTENILVRYEGGYTKLTKNYAHFAGTPVKSVQFVKDVIAGYEESYAQLIQHADEIMSLIESRPDVCPRYLIRTTAYYTLVMNKIVHPSVSRDFSEKFEPLIKEYLNYEGAHPRFKAIIPYEANSLAAYDIPIFYIKCQSTSLYSSDQEEIRDFLTRPPLEQLRTNFTRPSEYLVRQRELIARSMHVHLKQL